MNMEDINLNEEKTPDETIKKYFGEDAPKEEVKKPFKSNFYRNLIICVIVLSICLGSVSFGLSAAGLWKGFDGKGVFGSSDDEKTEETTEARDGLFGNGEVKPMAVNAESMYQASLNRVALIKRVRPSVIAINTTAYTEDWFFGTQQVNGSGSGFIFAKDAYNVYAATNNHVVSGAVDMTATFDGDITVPAKIVGTDQNSDLAVISITAEDLTKAGITNVTMVAFGDSDSLSEGDPVIAIENALGKGISATSGIISGTTKPMNIDGRTLDVIQTDSAFNLGGFGGPVFNSKGEVVGIATTKATDDGVEGMGYSIASNTAAPIFERLAKGKSTPTLGVTVTSVPSEYVSQIGTSAGAYIYEVTEGGNADMAGLKAGDVITSFGGKTVFGPDQLVEYVRECKSGDSIEVSGIREGKSFNVELKLYPPKNSQAVQ